MATSLPSIETVAANLRAVRAMATPTQVREGRAWYPGMRRMIREVAHESFHSTGDAVSLEFAAGVFAAYSQNATWKANITMATRYLNGEGPRGMKSVLAELDRMEDGVSPEDVIGALKRPDFYRNLIGRMEYVTCDRWHLRAAFASDARIPLTADVRELVTAATRIVAAENGEDPASCQAVIWCAIRGDGK